MGVVILFAKFSAKMTLSIYPLPRMGVSLVSFWVLSAAEAFAESPLVATLSDGRVRIELSLRTSGGKDALPHYQVTFNNQEMIIPSRLGVELEKSEALGGPCEVVSYKAPTVWEEYVQAAGNSRRVTDCSFSTRTTTCLRFAGPAIS